MSTRWSRLAWVAAVAVVVLVWAAPAEAQNGTMSGRVIDADRRTTDRNGKPLAGRPNPTDFHIGLSEATVTLELKAEPARKFEVITDALGEWYKSGLPPGTYDISVHREWRDPDSSRTTKMVVFTAKLTGVALKPGEKLRVTDILGQTEEARKAGGKRAATSEIAKQSSEEESLLGEANAAVAAGDFTTAIAKLTIIAEKRENCAVCLVKIGEYQVKLTNQLIDKKDQEGAKTMIAQAEASFIKAMEMDPKNPDPPNQLASIYNSQRRFDEAAKMGAKYNELMGSTGGGTDPVAIFRQGVIFWNGDKHEEARNEFAKVVKLDPKNADAHYFLGLSTFTLASSGKAPMIDAKAPLEAYLKLDPKGQYAEVAKALLANIK